MDSRASPILHGIPLTVWNRAGVNPQEAEGSLVYLANPKPNRVYTVILFQNHKPAGTRMVAHHQRVDLDMPAPPQPTLSIPEGPHNRCATLPRETQHFSSCNSNSTAALIYHPKHCQRHWKFASTRLCDVHSLLGLTTLPHITLLLKNASAGGSTDLFPHCGIDLLVFRGCVESWWSLCPCQSLKQSGSRGRLI